MQSVTVTPVVRSPRFATNRTGFVCVKRDTAVLDAISASADTMDTRIAGLAIVARSDHPLSAATSQENALAWLISLEGHAISVVQDITCTQNV